MKLAIGSDEAGFNLKSAIMEYLEAEGHEYEDYGVYDKARRCILILQ